MRKRPKKRLRVAQDPQHRRERLINWAYGRVAVENPSLRLSREEVATLLDRMAAQGLLTL